MSRENELAILLAMYQKKYGVLAAQTVKLIQQYLAEGYSAEKAIRLALGEANFFTVNSEATANAVTQAAALGYGVTNGEKYQSETIHKIILHEAWTSDKMNLSERLHGKQPQMRQEIIDTVSAAMRQGKSWVQASRDLYTGYSKGNVTNKTELPKYLDDLTVQAKKVLAGDKAAMDKYKAAIKKAQRQVDKLAQNGAPTKTMKQAFRNLVDAAKELNAEALENSIMVAVEEKSRYIADRISRTEMSRAWGDGFFAKHLDDPDVIAFKWKLNSRHPVFDICDIHASVDMYGLGAGVYPKDRFPVRPAHPHCMCLVSPVYIGGIDIDGAGEAALLSGAKFNPAAVDKYIADLPRGKQLELLGVVGLKAWESGESWQNHLRLWAGHEKPGTRLKKQDFGQTENKSLEGYSLNIRQQVQNRHIRGTKEYEAYVEKLAELNLKPSIITYQDMQGLVNQYHGKGTQDKSVGAGSPREVVKVDFVVGQYWNKQRGMYIDTTAFKIVYSKKGTHIFPTWDGTKE